MPLVNTLTGPEKYFVGIIDGTGPRNQSVGGASTPGSNDKYDKVMAPGFCKQLEKQFSNMLGSASVRYERGPANSGAGLADAIQNTKSAVLAQDPKVGIILVGYSRGAFGCIRVSDAISSEWPGRTIFGMILFDPVDRYAGSLTHFNAIPNNVLYSYRVFRKLNKKIYAKYDGSIQDVQNPVLNYIENPNPFRPGFGTTGRSVRRGGVYQPGNHEIQEYVGSHGALGGVGYRWVDDDKACEQNICADVRRWVSARTGMNVSLLPGVDPFVGMNPKPQYPVKEDYKPGLQPYF